MISRMTQETFSLFKYLFVLYAAPLVPLYQCKKTHFGDGYPSSPETYLRLFVFFHVFGCFYKPPFTNQQLPHDRVYLECR